MPSYHVWTVGCQMNMSDSERLGAGMTGLGLGSCDTPEDADVVVLNTCVVRQSAEDTATGMLGKLKKVKDANPDRMIVVMGCMVGPNDADLRRRFPQVDLWARPQDFNPILESVAFKHGIEDGDLDGCLANLVPNDPKVATFVPITHGCDKFCTFCIIPYRRGRETSRLLDELVDEAKMLVQRGVKEITLLGQNVDSYGHDLDHRKDLADLLEAIQEVDGIERIRFLTSHPNDMSTRIIQSIADLPKVCETVNLPFQAGDDVVLANMRRGYTRGQYLEKIDEIRDILGDDVALTTDVIVGFPGEDEEQFENTLEIVERVGFEKVHSAAYSERPGTVASRKFPDTVSQSEKKRRHQRLDAVQCAIQTEKHAGLVGSFSDILLEGRKRGRMFGRNRNDKIVYIDGDDHSDCNVRVGETITVEITESTAFSLVGQPLD
ncbi:MAG: tRNA (N6-isopentenyl adenosine(37)-C2)-methylthiotransferase MiaB [Chloroflexi bacterium]|nr:tRNA (N6-isopentenyl adenosine(37)-C2)-methylthiotransferase MiaB [Chloroflexota bacterium]MYK60765.1 tRNA (N6-isopentenyl adenosine(37)-C2)-methylthiotransferase MiaB [Chloroflexota bacterium]